MQRILTQSCRRKADTLLHPQNGRLLRRMREVTRMISLEFLRSSKITRIRVVHEFEYKGESEVYSSSNFLSNILEQENRHLERPCLSKIRETIYKRLPKVRKKNR